MLPFGTQPGWGMAVWSSAAQQTCGQRRVPTWMYCAHGMAVLMGIQRTGWTVRCSVLCSSVDLLTRMASFVK